MSERFLKYKPSDKASILRSKHPFAFLLLSLIAERVQREDCKISGLKKGECYVGDYNSIAATRGQYRVAIEILTRYLFIEIIETCRTRKSKKNKFTTTQQPPSHQKTATETTTVGTKVKLIDSSIWDININVYNHRNNQSTTTEPPKNNHEQEEEVTSINIEDNHKEKAQPAKRLYSKDLLTFNKEKKLFEGISPEDVSSWKEIYPSIDLAVEKQKATQWLLSNPSKANKTLWRKFLTGWYHRANDYVENKKAFKSISGIQSIDRRTQTIEGQPIASPADGRF